MLPAIHTGPIKDDVVGASRSNFVQLCAPGRAGEMINKTLLICEGGLFTSWAERLSREYERVLLFRPWTRSLPHPNDIRIASGYPQFERIEHFWEHVDEADTICFLDTHFADWADYLRQQGKPVWAPFYGEELEVERVQAKEVMEQVGLPVAPYKVIVGMSDLRDYLQAHENQVVKISKLRGLTETFTSDYYELIKPKLDEIEHKLGGGAEIQEFVCEDKIEAITEEGYDGWCIDGVFPGKAVVSCEIKDRGAASIVKAYAELNPDVRLTNDKMSPILQEFGYRSFISSEIRKTKKSFFPIDWTCRAASPCGENLQELFSNMGGVIEAGAHGEVVEPIPVGKYAAQAMIASPFATENWLPIYIPEEVRSSFKLYHSCLIEGQEYIVPTSVDMEEIGTVVATGNTMDEAITKVKKLAKEIEGYQVHVDVDALEEAKEELEKVT